MKMHVYSKSVAFGLLVVLSCGDIFGQARQRLFFETRLTSRKQYFDFSDDGGKVDPNGRRLTYGFTLTYFPTEKLSVQTGVLRNTFSDDINVTESLLRSRSNPFAAVGVPLHIGWQPLSDDKFSFLVFTGFTTNWLEGVIPGVSGHSFSGVSSSGTVFDYSLRAQTQIGTRTFITLDGGFTFGFDLSRRLRGSVCYLRNFGFGKNITTTQATYTITEGVKVSGPFTATVSNDGDASQWSFGLQYMFGPDVKASPPRIQKRDSTYLRKENARVVRLLNVGIINPSIEWERPLSRFTTLSIQPGVGYGISYPALSRANTLGFLYLIAPFLDVQSRYYYSLQRRSMRGKSTENNTASFLSLRLLTRGPTLATNFSRQNEIDLAAGPTWGVRHNSGRVTILFDVGPVIYWDRENRGFFPLILQLNVGYRLANKKID